ncbi:MAG: NYN domain-containing protein, partial [Lachnospiraceae bacterium]|nr:NYN domain-containing protein [Lachnospiraceae bacterium]
MENKRFALLIDADNISAKYISDILEELSTYGITTYKRIYGDWTSTQANKWKGELLENSVIPVQQFSNTVGKNATDSTLIIDAMDILYTGNVEGFCIVSSDSDFTRLASRLRESGMEVIGMGEEKTPRSFRVACTRFVNLENLSSQDVDAEKEGKDNTISREVIFNAITNIINENENKGKSVELAAVGNRLVNMYPDFDVRNYGYSLLSRFVEDAGLFLLEKNQNVITISLRDNEQSQEEIRNFVRDAIYKAGSRGIGISELSNRVYNKYSNFNVKDFGYSQFSKFVQGIESVEVYQDRNHRKHAR